MSTIPERWAEQARYDLETAEAMLAAGRLLYVVFCSQQAVEKMLKGVIADRTDSFPPRVHNLMRLAQVASLDLSEDQEEFLRELSAYYIQSRYPEEIDALSGGVTRELACDVLRKSGEMLAWLSSIL